MSEPGIDENAHESSVTAWKRESFGGLGGKKMAGRVSEGQMLGVGVSQVSITTSAARKSAINCEI